MKCQLFDRYLFDYCDDDLSPVLREKIDKHLQECTNCSNKVKLTVLENEVLRDNSDLPLLAGDFTNRVMHQITNSGNAYPEAINGRLGWALRRPVDLLWRLQLLVWWCWWRYWHRT